MAKRPSTLSVRIPPYQAPRNTWRRQINALVHQEKVRSRISYSPSDKLEVDVILYMDKTALSFHDVDNRLKDILDALQARAGGSKKRRTLPPIIKNDSQIYRVIIEKALPPPQSHNLGHLTIRKFGRRRLVRQFISKRTNHRSTARRHHP